MNKLYAYMGGDNLYIVSDNPNVLIKCFVQGSPCNIKILPVTSGEFLKEHAGGYFRLVANNYQEKPKCSQPDSLSSSCHASETTAKSRGLLSRICSLFSSSAKKLFP